jgi:hypothetical protein
MQIRVHRDACCAQDDQMGPLEAVYGVTSGTTFMELIVMIVESRFLQYSASHVTLLGEVAGTPVVRVFSSFYLPGREAEYMVDGSQMAASVVGTRPLEFRFTFE